MNDLDALRGLAFNSKGKFVRHEPAPEFYERIRAKLVEWMATIAFLKTRRAAQDAEIDRLRAALSWIDNTDPEIVAAAEVKFGFNLAGSDTEKPCPTGSN